MIYQIREVDGVLNRDIIEQFNALDPYFPPLQDKHLELGFWWLVDHIDEGAIAFAGLVPFTPFDGYGYLKRCYVKPKHMGHGLQFRLMCARELKARQLAWKHLASECLEGNEYSAHNFRRAGFTQIFPEQPWAVNSLYWVKAL